MNSQNYKPKFRCGLSVWLLRCQYDKKGTCTFDDSNGNNGIKCVNRGRQTKRGKNEFAKNKIMV